MFLRHHIKQILLFSYCVMLCFSWGKMSFYSPKLLTVLEKLRLALKPGKASWQNYPHNNGASTQGDPNCLSHGQISCLIFENLFPQLIPLENLVEKNKINKIVLFRCNQPPGQTESTWSRLISPVWWFCGGWMCSLSVQDRTSSPKANTFPPTPRNGLKLKLSFFQWRTEAMQQVCIAE